VHENDEIIIQVYDRDKFTKDQFMGEVRLNKSDFVDNNEGWYALQSRMYKYDRVHGDIYLKFSVD